jgi:hypothetical protein
MRVKNKLNAMLRYLRRNQKLLNFDVLHSILTISEPAALSLLKLHLTHHLSNMSTILLLLHRRSMM